MSEQLTRIKGAILQEYQSHGHIDRDGWLARYPGFREDLLAVFRLFDAAEAAEGSSTAEPWPDYRGMVARERQNILRMAEIHVANPEESALGQAIENVVDPFVRPRPGTATVDEKTLRVFALGLVVQALFRTGARLHQFMGQKLSDLANAALHLNLWQHVPYAYGMFDETLYAVEEDASELGWLRVQGKYYAPTNLLEAEIARLSPEILSQPELTQRVIEYFAGQDSTDLEVWGMTRYAGVQLVARGQRISVAAVLQFFRDTPAWKYKVEPDPSFGEVMIAEYEVARALEHLVRLRLLPPHEVDLIA